MSEALDTLKSVAKAGLAVAINRPAARADRVRKRRGRDKEDIFDICELNS